MPTLGVAPSLQEGVRDESIVEALSRSGLGVSGQSFLEGRQTIRPTPCSSVNLLNRELEETAPATHRWGCDVSVCRPGKCVKSNGVAGGLEGV